MDKHVNSVEGKEKSVQSKDAAPKERTLSLIEEAELDRLDFETMLEEIRVS